MLSFVIIAVLGYWENVGHYEELVEGIVQYSGWHDIVYESDGKQAGCVKIWSSQ